MKQTTKEHLLYLLNNNIFEIERVLNGIIHIENKYSDINIFFEENKESLIQQLNDLEDMKKELE